MKKQTKIIYSTKWIAYTAMLTALVIATGFIPPVPTPAGRIYWVDGMVLIAAYLMDPVSAFISGGVGTLIYDILQSPSMMLTSFLTHGLQAVAVSVFVHIIFPKKHEFIWAIVSSVIGAVIVISGYFSYRCVTLGAETALINIPRNIIQEVIGISVAMILCYATTFKRQLKRSGLLPDFTRDILSAAKNKSRSPRDDNEVINMKTKRILTMQDLSCVGQCSLTVALPVLSRYGVETCVLPTAVLSNHTMFDGWSYLDLTDEIKNIYAYWEKNDFKFDAFLLGYLGKKELMDIAVEGFEKFSAKGAPVIIDPVFGDNGKLYGGFDLQYVAEMRKLIKHADIIMPNITEACYLTDTAYTENQSEKFIKELADKLFAITGKTVIITGAEKGGLIGEYILSDGKSEYVLLPKEPQKRHGTGDIFASVFTANYLSGKTLADSCRAASQFVIDCLKATDEKHFYGVNFESVLNKS